MIFPIFLCQLEFYSVLITKTNKNLKENGFYFPSYNNKPLYITINPEVRADQG